MTTSTQNRSKWLDVELRLDSDVYNKHEVVMVRGQGATVWDDAARRGVWPRCRSNHGTG